MRRWLRVLALYSPAMALVIAGLVVLAAYPVYSNSQSFGCNCPQGAVCMCPSVGPGTYSPNPLGPPLLYAAWAYAGIVSLLVVIRGRRPVATGRRPATV